MVLCISTYPVCGSSCAHLGASGGVKPAVSADVAGFRVGACMCFWPRKAAGHTEEPLVETNKAGWKLSFA